MTITIINGMGQLVHWKRRRNTQLIWMTRKDFINSGRRKHFGYDFETLCYLVEVRYDPS